MRRRKTASHAAREPAVISAWNDERVMDSWFLTIHEMAAFARRKI